MFALSHTYYIQGTHYIIGREINWLLLQSCQCALPYYFGASRGYFTCTPHDYVVYRAKYSILYESLDLTALEANLTGHETAKAQPSLMEDYTSYHQVHVDWPFQPSTLLTASMIPLILRNPQCSLSPPPLSRTRWHLLLQLRLPPPLLRLQPPLLCLQLPLLCLQLPLLHLQPPLLRLEPPLLCLQPPLLLPALIQW